MRLLFVAFVTIGAVFGIETRAASAQMAPFCDPDEEPRFVSGFADLSTRLGATMGEPVECAHDDGDTGDTLQQTTSGLAYWRKSTNTPTFTNGWDHWALTPAGLVYWEGTAADPPGGIDALTRPAAAASASAGPTIDQRLFPAWRELMALPSWGRRVADTMTRSKTNIVVGSLGGGAIAAYAPRQNVIVVASEYLSEDSRALAAVLAHEATHVDQIYTGRFNGGTMTDCRAREVEALEVEVLVWQAFWNGFGPARTALQRLENYQLQVYSLQSLPGLARLVVDNPGYRRQCGA